MASRLYWLTWRLRLLLAIPAAAILNRVLSDEPGFRRLLVAPEDDEPVTEEDRAAILAAKKRLGRGQLVRR